MQLDQLLAYLLVIARMRVVPFIWAEPGRSKWNEIVLKHGKDEIVYFWEDFIIFEQARVRRLRSVTNAKE